MGCLQMQQDWLYVIIIEAGGGYVGVYYILSTFVMSENFHNITLELKKNAIELFVKLVFRPM